VVPTSHLGGLPSHAAPLPSSPMLTIESIELLLLVAAVVPCWPAAATAYSVGLGWGDTCWVAALRPRLKPDAELIFNAFLCRP